MQVREHIGLSREIKDFIIADAVLTFAFALIFTGGLANAKGQLGLLLYMIPISFVAVTCSFVFHELMHKFTAQHFGAIAGFRTSTMGLVITILSAFLGFLIGIPGATLIYTNNFTKRENGIVSLAGPLTNFVVFGAFFFAGLALFPHLIADASLFFNQGRLASSYIQNMIIVTMYIAILLAFFNMLPIFPLDGSKVIAWNFPVWLGVIVAIFAVIVGVLQFYAIIPDLVILLVIAVLFNLFYRGVGLGF